jgi:hypothetical protein
MALNFQKPINFHQQAIIKRGSYHGGARSKELVSNPYESPDSTAGGTLAKPSAFPLLSAGPATGAAVGLTHVASMVGVWAINGYPDAFFRTPNWAWIAAVFITRMSKLLTPTRHKFFRCIGPLRKLKMKAFFQ